MIKYGIITERGTVIESDGREHSLPHRGTDDEGYPEVLMDARSVGGDGWMYRQSIKPYIGMKCKFVTYNNSDGYNFEIIE